MIDDNEIKGKLKYLTDIILNSTGAERLLAFHNRTLLENGYYSTDELIEMSLANGFRIFNPLTCIRRGTIIQEGAVIGNGTTIEGENVVVGNNTVIRGSAITGSNISIGSHNDIRGALGISNLSTGDNNIIDGINGINSGNFSIGSNNNIMNITINNNSNSSIIVGDNNELCSGLNLNIPFPHGSIWIGYNNSLGRDGGGVISSSYRFGKKWGGHVAIGGFVETTRGAEILGYSMIGWPLNFIESAFRLKSHQLTDLFVNRSIAELNNFFEEVLVSDLSNFSKCLSSKDIVSLYGVIKAKRCCLTGKVKIKDDTRLHCSFLKNASIPERCKVYNSSIVSSSDDIINIPAQDFCLANKAIRTQSDLRDIEQVQISYVYPSSDYIFFNELP